MISGSGTGEIGRNGGKRLASVLIFIYCARNCRHWDTDKEFF